MAIEKKTIRLLLLEDSQNEAERLISLFRNAGHATRLHRVTSEEDLTQALQQSWDLFMVAPESDNLDPMLALNLVKRSGKDIAIVQILPEADPELFTEALELGAHDAVPQGEDQRLLLVGRRELENLYQRRALRAAQVSLREIEKRCQLLLDSSVDAIAYVHEGMHVYANRSYLALFGYDDGEELEGMPMTDLISASDQAAFKDYLKTYQHQGSASEFSCQGLRADGSALNMRIQCSEAQYDGEPCIQTIIRVDNDNAELEEKLRELSSQDLITGLYNRNHFIELLDQATERAVNAGQAAALAYIRLDRYPTLQVELGITGIDLLLADIAALLQKHLPETTELARFGDDVFCALLPLHTQEQASEPLQKLLKAIELHLFEINGRTVQITLSIGLAGVNDTTSNAQLVLNRASVCAEQISGGNGLKLFCQQDELAAAASRGDISAMLKKAMDNNEFRLLFQPIISLRGADSEFYEVLLRLTNEQGVEISPRELVQSALEAGLAGKMDRWVIGQSIKQLLAQRTEGHNTCLFINVTQASLQDPELLPWLNTALKSARLPADALVLQIAENDAVTYLKPAKAFTQGLAQLHCKVSLSHFGTVLNPMNTLKHLQVDFVKVDAVFAQNLSSQDSQEVLKALLEELHQQGKQTLVPRVENAATLSVLWQVGADLIQGHYLQAPTPEMNYDFAGSDE